MKGFVFVTMSVGCLLFLSGCGHNSEHAVPSQKEPDRDRRPSGVALELNDGQKWRVDDHTRGSIVEMTRLIEGTAPVDSVDDAQALAGAFDAGLQDLIQGCTLTGPAHDQLHVFLAALFPKLAELKGGTNPEELRATQQEIRSLFDTYDLYFE